MNDLMMIDAEINNFALFNDVDEIEHFFSDKTN